MASDAPNLKKLDERLTRHWKWVGLLALAGLLIFGNLVRSLVADMGGSAHVRKVGVLDAMSHTMTDKLMTGVQGKAPAPKVVRADITFSVVHFLLLLIVVAAMRGRLDAIGRLKVLREELEFRG